MKPYESLCPIMRGKKYLKNLLTDMKGKFDFQNITLGGNNELPFQSEMSPKFSTEAIAASTAIYSIF